MVQSRYRVQDDERNFICGFKLVLLKSFHFNFVLGVICHYQHHSPLPLSTFSSELIVRLYGFSKACTQTANISNYKC